MTKNQFNLFITMFKHITICLKIHVELFTKIRIHHHFFTGGPWRGSGGRRRSEKYSTEPIYTSFTWIRGPPVVRINTLRVHWNYFVIWGGPRRKKVKNHCVRTNNHFVRMFPFELNICLVNICKKSTNCRTIFPLILLSFQRNIFHSLLAFFWKSFLKQNKSN